MNKTSKWIPMILLFLILLLCALLLFAMLGQQAGAGDLGGNGTTSTSGTQSDEPPPTSSPSPSDTQTTPSDGTSSDTKEDPASTLSGPTSQSTDDTEPLPTVDLNAKRPLYDAHGVQIAEVTIEEYLCGALLNAISFTYEPSALQAQAIALRTAVYAHVASGGSLSTEAYGYKDYDALLPVWGTEFAVTIWNRITSAVTNTKGQVLMRNGALYTFDIVGEHGILLAETDIGKQAKSRSASELLALYYPSATILQDFEKNS